MTPELLLQIEKETGFTAFENAFMGKPQFTFYGTSDKYEAFKTIIGENASNGTIAYLMDSGDSHLYSAYKKTWY